MAVFGGVVVCRRNVLVVLLVDVCPFHVAQGLLVTVGNTQHGGLGSFGSSPCGSPTVFGCVGGYGKAASVFAGGLRGGVCWVSWCAVAL